MRFLCFLKYLYIFTYILEVRSLTWKKGVSLSMTANVSSKKTETEKSETPVTRFKAERELGL